MAKRYLLLLADAELSEDDFKELTRIIGLRHPAAKVIPVAANRRAVIVKTTNQWAPLLRDESENLTLGQRRLAPVSTSGAIGKLKKRAASGSPDNGEIPQR